MDLSGYIWFIKKLKTYMYIVQVENSNSNSNSYLELVVIWFPFEIKPHIFNKV